MKKVLLLGALLSTMAFGTAPEGAKPATAEVSLTGTAVPVLEITGGGDFEFGDVVIKTSKTLNKTFTIKGADGYTVTLNATLSGTVVSLDENILTVGIGSEGSTATTSEGRISVTATGVTKDVYVKYAPTEIGHTLDGEILTLTATYE
jgi:ABC-type Fe3+-hydroxamate transport system substrate-binding protein